jgi:hypothetical protein
MMTIDDRGAALEPTTEDFRMNANDVMKDLSRKHKRFPKAALSAAVTMRSDVAPLMIEELKRLPRSTRASMRPPSRNTRSR